MAPTVLAALRLLRQTGGRLGAVTHESAAQLDALVLLLGRLGENIHSIQLALDLVGLEVPCRDRVMCAK